MEETHRAGRGEGAQSFSKHSAPSTSTCSSPQKFTVPIYWGLMEPQCTDGWLDLWALVIELNLQASPLLRVQAGARRSIL